MNNICLVINQDLNEVELDFKNNIFKMNNNVYIFSYKNINELIINNNDIYYTEDSYLYFKDLSEKNYIKKIFLIHNEWIDQAIINLYNNTLIRIQSNNQFGKFLFNDDKLIIMWNYWGKENYYKYDEYTYIQENYAPLEAINVNIKIPIHIFIHVCMIDEWENILLELLNKIKNSGLYDIIDNIHIGILGDSNNLKNNIFNDPKIKIAYIDSRIYLFELHTINYIKSFCKDILDEEIYILYIHTKGVRRAGNKIVIDSWREMMTYFLIDCHKDCLKNLSFFDTIGNNIVNLRGSDKNFINKNHTLHYSGNYWWTKKTYINKLPYLNINFNDDLYECRFNAENWILSNYPDSKIGILFQDNTNTHPYHRYIFDYYKNKKILFILYN